MLDRHSPIPLYYQLKLRLEEMLKQYGAGARLPTEKELRGMFGVSRATVRQALSELANEGKLEKRRGYGSFVAERSLAGALTHIMSLGQQLDSLGLSYSTKVLAVDVRRPDEAISEELGIEPNASIVYVERLRLLKGVPFYLSQGYLPYPQCAPLLDADLVHVTLFRLLVEQCQMQLERVERYLEPLLAEAHHARLLDVPVGSPLHYLQTYTFGDEDRPWGYFRDYFRGDRSRFYFTIERQGDREPSITVAPQLVAPVEGTHADSHR